MEIVRANFSHWRVPACLLCLRIRFVVSRKRLQVGSADNVPAKMDPTKHEQIEFWLAISLNSSPAWPDSLEFLVTFRIVHCSQFGIISYAIKIIRFDLRQAFLRQLFYFSFRNLIHAESIFLLRCEHEQRRTKNVFRFFPWLLGSKDFVVLPCRRRNVPGPLETPCRANQLPVSPLASRNELLGRKSGKFSQRIGASRHFVIRYLSDKRKVDRPWQSPILWNDKREIHELTRSEFNLW